MGFLSVIRRRALRDKMPIREISRRTGLSRNTVKKYLREDAQDTWLEEAEESLLGAFARGLLRDQAAVAAALREPWSNGQTEEQINRLKTIQRQMYGRTTIDLLVAAS